MNSPDLSSQSEKERLRQELLRERASTTVLRREVLRLQRSLSAQRRFFDLLRGDVESLFDSLTWKIGATVADTVRRLTLRPRAPLVRDHMESVIEAALQYRSPAGPDLSDQAMESRILLGSLLSADQTVRIAPLLAIAAPEDAILRVAALVARRADFSPSGSAYIRLLEPMEALVARGAVELNLIETSGEIDGDYDCVIVQRNAIPRLAAAQELRNACSLNECDLIFEIDDDLFATHFQARPGYSSESLAAMRYLAAEADAVTCSSGALAKRLEQLSDHVTVIENGLSEQRWLQSEPAYSHKLAGPVRILYMGTRTHQHDLKLFAPAWKKLQARYGNAIALERVGVVAERARAIGDPIAVPGTDARKDSYPSFVEWITKQKRWDIGIAPLRDTDFNRAKSPVKYLDYAALGLAVVASDVGPYRAAIKHESTGLLVAPTADAWFDAIERLIEDPALRRDVASNAHAELRDHYTVAATAGRWVHLIDELRAKRRCAAAIDSLTLDEASYLEQNLDVAEGVRRGDFASASQHWDAIGRFEIANGARSYQARRAECGAGTRSLSTEYADAMAAQAKEWTETPLISVLTPVYKVPLEWLTAAVESVRKQVYEHWELCICDDASDDPAITDYLATLHDPRIKVCAMESNQGISEASNAALALATGSHVALLDHDDELAPDALWHMAKVIADRDPDLLYSDEAKLELDGTVCEPHYKPDFSRELIQSQNYLSHLSVLRRSCVIEVGGFRRGVEGSQDHDLLLRVCQLARSVHHIPRVLYYWRKVPESTAASFDEKAYAWKAGVTALNDLSPLGDVARHAEKGRFPGTYRVRRATQSASTVTVLIPFRDQPELLIDCVNSILEKTDHQNFEIIGVNNQSVHGHTFDAMAELEKTDRRVRFITYDRPFNFSAINNFGARHASGAHLLLLNNDIVIDTAQWMSAMLEHSQLDDVGAVGALLLYPDGSVQHAGAIIGVGGVAGHSHKYLPGEHHGYFSRPHLVQNVSAVTGACLMVKRALYLRIGGLNETNLGIAFNDIDFCLRLRERGYLNVYTPYARAVHHESKSRGQEDTPDKQARFRAESQYMRRRHAEVLFRGDPYYSPNLSLEHEDFRARVE